MTNNPDRTLKHVPSRCHHCGDKLTNRPEIISKRQVVDIPTIKSITTKHQLYAVQCCCGQQTKAKYPKHVAAPISYGTNIEVSINYLSSWQYVSISRIKEFPEQFIGISMREGTIVNKLNRFCLKAKVSYEKLREDISNSKVIGTDEAGCVVNGNKHWM